jgi:hypothetical protein
MKRYVLIGLKLVASFPLAWLIGGLAAYILETGLWPLLFLPEDWLHVIDTGIVCRLVMLGYLIWFWALDR